MMAQVQESPRCKHIASFICVTSANIPLASHMAKPNTNGVGKYTGGRGASLQNQKIKSHSPTVQLTPAAGQPSGGKWGWLLPACPPWSFCSSSPTLPTLISDLARSKKRERKEERGRKALTGLVLASLSVTQEIHKVTHQHSLLWFFLSLRGSTEFWLMPFSFRAGEWCPQLRAHWQLLMP